MVIKKAVRVNPFFAKSRILAKESHKVTKKLSVITQALSILSFGLIGLSANLSAQEPADFKFPEFKSCSSILNSMSQSSTSNIKNPFSGSVSASVINQKNTRLV